jgi:quercetin dioxygenase-like cupin family protein
MRLLLAMKLVRVQESERPTDEGVFARMLLEGDQSNVRIIRLGVGQVLPPHRHGVSDLMLYAVSGVGELELPDRPIPFGDGALAFYRGDEELRVRSTGSTELLLLAFLAPKFPPA